MNLPVGEAEAREAARHVLELPGADGVEVVIAGSTIGMTRYANSQIIQNTVRKEVHAHVRVALADRAAQASTNQLDAEHIRRAAERALEAAKSSPPDEDWPGLPEAEVVGRARAAYRWDEATAAASATARAEAVGSLLDAVAPAGAAGIYETSSHSYGVFSSEGIDCYDGFTRCVTTCLADNSEATGWGEASSHRASDVDVAQVALKARHKADAGRGAVGAEPGTYEVVLEAPAVATFLDFLSYAGFGAKGVIEGESFLSSKTGDRVAAEGVTIGDDVWDPLSVGVGFDLEGVPKQTVHVIEAGLAVQPVTDLRTAAKLGLPNTGHGSGSAEFGPYAANVTVAPGDASDEELIAGVEDGFLVTRFHYTNVLDRPTALLTGMTRDGLFRIRKGEVAEPVHNFRFAQSALEAFASTQAIGRERVAFAPDYGSYGSTVAAPMRIGEFRFASTTSH